MALAYRVNHLKVFGLDLFYAAIRVFKLLWPEAADPKDPKELADRLMQDSQGQLNAWRESAGRMGADEAMTFVLSWYEDLDLDLFQSYRPESRH